MKLTKASIAGLVLPPGKADAVFFDDDIPGFGIRLRSGGKRTWVVQYRTGAKQRRVTLGDVRKLDADKARVAARTRLAQVTLGGDPQADKLTARSMAATTLGSVVESYLAVKEDKLRRRTFTETERYLRKYWRPLHNLPVNKIERHVVAARLTEMTAEHGPIAATRARAALSALFVWAMGQGTAKENPVIGTNRPAEPQSRERVLTLAELREIWNACRDDDYGRIVRLLILTGQRRHEVGGMTWSELEAATWSRTIPGARTKNKRAHTITLPAAATSILERTQRRESTDHVFGTGNRGFGGWSKAKTALDTRILKARKLAAKGTRRPGDHVKAMTSWTLHDIRRSVATHMAELGTLPHIIEAVLNHVSGHKAGIAGVYNLSTYGPDKKAALAIWAEHVWALIEDREARVVRFPS